MVANLGRWCQLLLTDDAERSADIDDESRPLRPEPTVGHALRQADRTVLRVLAHPPAHVVEVDDEPRWIGEHRCAEADWPVHVQDDAGDRLVDAEAHAHDLRGFARQRPAEEEEDDRGEEGKAGRQQPRRRPAGRCVEPYLVHPQPVATPCRGLIIAL
ncbi:MAG: hypothetical protein R3D25_21205 [Geminicoccaceae bacterium]